MGLNNIVGARDASDLIRFPSIYAQALDAVERSSENGIFIGNMHSLPYFLDFESLMNPHVFICGITGSGKTYLMRNLAIKLRSLMNFRIMIIDFTGEYAVFSEMFYGKDSERQKMEDFWEGRSDIAYINLKNKGNEQARITSADEILQTMIGNMRKIGGGGVRTFIFLDEAWKLLAESKALQTILREGRKYRCGLVFSSQLVEDFDPAILSNAATLFVFRLQNKRGLNVIAKNYNLKERQIEIVQNLRVGSCIVIQTNAFREREFILINRVGTVELGSFVNIILGNGMELEISKEKFEMEVKNICSKEVLARFISEADKRGSLNLSLVVRLLTENGANRGRVLTALRNLGVHDEEIADAFSAIKSDKLASMHGWRVK